MTTKAKPKQTRSKPAAVSAETRAAEKYSEDPAVVAIDIKSIDRHPKNRVIVASDPKTKELSESIATYGQRDPARVRLLASGRYQMLSGERRLVAAKLAGKSHLRCLVVECDDTTADRELALGNASRENLDPIERAELLNHLTAAIADGGSGMSRAEAGAIFGLKSESGYKNAVRLLRLPPSLRAHVASGAIPERAARRIITFDVAPAVMDLIAKDFDRLISKPDEEWDLAETIQSLCEEQRTPYFIQEFIREVSRPWDKKDQEWMGKIGQYRKRRFEPTEAQKAELRIVELPGKQFRCLNVALWEELNRPFEEKEAKRQEAASGKPKAKADGKPLTPKEIAAEERRKAKEADEKLAKFTREWVRSLVRATLADSTDSKMVHCLFAELANSCRSDIGPFLDLALFELGLNTPKASRVPTLASLEAGQVIEKLWSILLWPVSSRLQPSRSKSRQLQTLAEIGTLPEKLPGYIDNDELADLARACKVTIEQAWKRATVADSDHRRLAAVWLCRHTKAQLRALIDSMSLGCGGEILRRDELAAEILACHLPGKPLPVPKMIIEAWKAK